MIIMIISFRTKRNTDRPDQTDTNKKEGATPDPSIREGNKKEDEQSHPLFFVISFLFDDSFLTVLNINALGCGLTVQLPTINRVPLITLNLLLITCHLMKVGGDA